MSLPVSIDNVPSNDRTIIGDLIITKGVIYFFPHTDLSRKHNLKSTDSILGLIGMLAEQTASAVWGWIGGGLIGLTHVVKHQLKQTSNSSRIRSTALWRDGNSSSMVQSKLDAHTLASREKERPIEEFSSSLPMPQRFAREEIKEVSLSRFGRLQFQSHYDKHQFSVGLRRKRLLRAALWEAGFSMMP